MSDEATSRRWLESLADVERTRHGLRRTHVPAGFEESLLSVPRAHPRHRGWWRTVTSVGVTALLACLMLVLIPVQNARARRQPPVVLGAFGASQMLDHAAAGSNGVGAEGVRLRLAAAVPYTVVFSPEPDAALVGGEVVSFRNGMVVRTDWKGPRGTYSDFEYRRSDYGALPSARVRLPLHDLEPTAPQCDLTAWTDGELGFLRISNVQR